MNKEELLKFAAERVRYEPETGNFFWKNSAGQGKRPENSQITTKTGDGYLRVTISINKIPYPIKLHRLAWFITHGEDPILIDHINRIKTDNRIENLRNVTPTQNSRNMSISSRNTSGFTGVCFKTNRWVAEFALNGKHQYVGRFKKLKMLFLPFKPPDRNTVLQRIMEHDDT